MQKKLKIFRIPIRNTEDKKKDNPVISPRFAAILRKLPYQVPIYPDPKRKHPFPTAKNFHSHKKTKMYFSDAMVWLQE